MFAQSFQSGESGIEIISPSGSLPASQLFDLTKCAATKDYDRDIKGYCFTLTKSTSCVTCPTSSRVTLGLTQSLIVFQLDLSTCNPLSLEFLILDSRNQKKRLNFSSSFTKFECNELHCQIPWILTSTTSWCNYIIDLDAYVSECFKNSTYQTLESFKLKCICRVRKIFTLPYPKSDLIIPTSFDFPISTEVPYILRSPEVDNFQYKGKKESTTKQMKNSKMNTQNTVTDMSNNNNNLMIEGSSFQKPNHMTTSPSVPSIPVVTNKANMTTTTGVKKSSRNNTPPLKTKRINPKDISSSSDTTSVMNANNGTSMTAPGSKKPPDTMTPRSPRLTKPTLETMNNKVNDIDRIMKEMEAIDAVLLPSHSATTTTTTTTFPFSSASFSSSTAALRGTVQSSSIAMLTAHNVINTQGMTSSSSLSNIHVLSPSISETEPPVYPPMTSSRRNSVNIDNNKLLLNIDELRASQTASQSSSSSSSRLSRSGRQILHNDYTDTHPVLSSSSLTKLPQSSSTHSAHSADFITANKIDTTTMIEGKQHESDILQVIRASIQDMKSKSQSRPTTPKIRNSINTETIPTHTNQTNIKKISSHDIMTNEMISSSPRDTVFQFKIPSSSSSSSSSSQQRILHIQDATASVPNESLQSSTSIPNTLSRQVQSSSSSSSVPISMSTTPKVSLNKSVHVSSPTAPVVIMDRSSSDRKQMIDAMLSRIEASISTSVPSNVDQVQMKTSFNASTITHDDNNKNTIDNISKSLQFDHLDDSGNNARIQSHTGVNSSSTIRYDSIEHTIINNHMDTMSGSLMNIHLSENILESQDAINQSSPTQIKPSSSSSAAAVAAVVVVGIDRIYDTVESRNSLHMSNNVTVDRKNNMSILHPTVTKNTSEGMMQDDTEEHLNDFNQYLQTQVFQFIPQMNTINQSSTNIMISDILKTMTSENKKATLAAVSHHIQVVESHLHTEIHQFLNEYGYVP